MRRNNRTARKLKKFAWRFRQPDWADNHGVLLPVKHKLVSPGIAREIYLGDYEANPELIPLIRETHAKNDVAPTLINALLAKGDGEREFHLEDDFWASSAHRTGGRSITVKQIDLNAELARVKPSFLIVDIEGGEAEFFAGAERSTVQKICVETHPDVLGDRVLSEMFAGLVAKGFALDFSLIRKNVFFFHRVA